tara:strand:- start:5606 stop:5800 length:195 start_codon:yes stop_codon:yes gene_type:complete
MTEVTLQKISDDLDFLKQKVGEIEINLEELNVHSEVKKEYVEKIKEIDAGKFLSEEEFEKEMKE